jgi:hypothetical protein
MLQLWVKTFWPGISPILARECSAAQRGGVLVRRCQVANYALWQYGFAGDNTSKGGECVPLSAGKG